MKLNKISNALRLSRRHFQPKSALYSSALLAFIASPAFAQNEVEAVEATTPNAQVSEQEADNKNDSPDMEVIKVSGLRGTMSRKS